MQQPPGRPETIRIATRKFLPFEKAIRREWTSFQNASGCKLALEVVAFDHHPLYEALFRNESPRCGEWDVAFVHTDWLAEAHQSRALLNLALNIEKEPPEDYPTGWTPSLLRLQQFGDEVLGLPYHDGPECLVYRKDLLEDAEEQRVFQDRFGEPLRVPRDWDEFVRLARFFHRPQKGLYGTVFAAYPDGHNTVYDICLQLWTRGGELFDSAGNMQLDTPEMIEAVEFYRAMLNDESAIHPESRQFDSVKSGEAFARGEVALMINWFGFAAMCDATADSTVRGRVSICAVPHAKSCAGASLNCYWMLSVAAGSRHPELAYQFVKHCMSRSADKQRTLEGVIGCRKSTWCDGEVNAAIPYYGQLEVLHDDARELPRLSEWVSLSEVVDQMVIAAIDSDEPVESIVRQFQAKADELQRSLE